LRLSGGVHYSKDGAIQSLSRPGEEPHVGEDLFFAGESPQVALRTTALLGIERPSKSIVAQYSTAESARRPLAREP
jgi:hypothetical protein